MRTIDLAVVAIYLIATIALGIAYRGRTGAVDEYFTARGMFRGRLGEILIGLSIAATFMSGISIIVYVSAAYSDGAKIGLGLICLPIAWWVLIHWFLPRYLAAGGVHAYDVVERRFGYPVRVCLSVMFFLLRVGWMGVMLYVPTLIIIGSTGLSPQWFWPIVLVIGLSSTVYTVIGGIRGVIVTDALQFIVIMGGMLLIVVLLLARLDLPWTALWADWAERGRLQVLDFSLDPTKSLTFWTVVLGISVANLGSYLADQMSLQRYLAAESIPAASRAFTVNAVGVAIVIVTLVLAGLLLSTWYQRHPDPTLPVKADHVLAFFIVRELPPGVAGVLIAAILAATISSMTSCINSLAGIITTDWLVRWGRRRSAEESYRLSRWISLLIGVGATLLAGFAENLGSVLDAQAKVMGAFLGPMLACLVLAVGRRERRGWTVLAGISAGVVAGWIVAALPVASLWVPPVSFGVAMAVAAVFRPVAAEALPPARGNTPT